MLATVRDLILNILKRVSVYSKLFNVQSPIDRWEQEWKY